MTETEDQPKQLINGELKSLAGMEATSTIPVIKSKAEYLKAVMYEGVRPLLLPFPSLPLPKKPQPTNVGHHPRGHSDMVQAMQSHRARSRQDGRGIPQRKVLPLRRRGV